MQAISRSRTEPSFARSVLLRDVSLDDARGRVISALRRHGFSVLAETNLADLLHRRADVVVPPTCVFEVCHPPFAARAMRLASDAAFVAVSSLCVWSERGGTALAILPAERAAMALGRARLDEVSAELTGHLEEVIADVARGPHEGEPALAQPAADTTLSMNAAECSELRSALDLHIQELTRELAATENHTYQHELAQTVARLESVSRKLQAASS